MIPGSCTLNHDGCIVCSDAGIPVKVISVNGEDALCEDALCEDALCEDAAGERAEIAIELVSPVKIGETLITHGGVAIGRVSE